MKLPCFGLELGYMCLPLQAWAELCVAAEASEHLGSDSGTSVNVNVCDENSTSEFIL